MCATAIDIKENDLMQYGQEVLERLLWDHSRPTYVDDEGNEQHHHIYWATDNYEERGAGYGFFDEISIASITGDNCGIVRPRALKSREEQLRRTRDKAEVFTPSWLCNDMNNLLDSEIFGFPDVFNTVDEPTHTWQAQTRPIPFPNKSGQTWKDYVWANQLEITCGEAPFLVSRYDTTTGTFFADTRQRIGLLDRKLRVVGEQCETIRDWVCWALAAVKSIYGFEWQGDNLLLAREAIFVSFIEYHHAFCEQKGITHRLQKDTLRKLANIISWNIFQMDGLKMVLPLTCHEEEKKKIIPASLFEPQQERITKVPCPGCKRKDPHLHNGIKVKIADWSVKNHVEPIEIVEFHTLLKEPI